MLFFIVLGPELTHDRLLAQSAVITADSTGESGVAGRELLANQNIRNEGVVITREILSWLSQSIQVSCFFKNRYKSTNKYYSRNAEL